MTERRIALDARGRYRSVRTPEELAARAAEREAHNREYFKTYKRASQAKRKDQPSP